MPLATFNPAAKLINEHSQKFSFNKDINMIKIKISLGGTIEEVINIKN